MLLERLFGERRSESLTTMEDPARWLLNWALGGAPTSAGEPVSLRTAEGLPAVYRCRQLLAWSVAQCPLELFSVSGATKNRAEGESLYRTLRDLPNPEMTAADFWSHQIDSLTGTGNAYAQIHRGVRGDVLNLWPLEASCMTVDRVPGTNQLRYTYALPNGTPQVFAWNPNTPQIWHLRINALDGIHGRSPIDLQRETLGRAIALGKYGSRFFKNGASSTGAFTVPGTLTKEQKDHFRAQITEHYTGENQHRPLLLSGGVDYKTFSIPPDQAQFIETMRYGRSDVAMIYGVPPHMIGETDKVTSWGSGIEQLGIGFVNHTIGYYLRLIQQAVKLYLLNQQTWTRYQAEFDYSGLLRGDMKSRFDAYRAGKEIGVLNTNEIRQRENMNPIEGDAGTEYWRPSNMGIAGEPPEPALAPPPAAPTPGMEPQAGQE